MSSVRERLITDHVQWTHEEQANDILGLYPGEFDPLVCGLLGPGGQDWGSLTIDTPHGTLELAPLDHIFRLANGPIVIASPSELIDMSTTFVDLDQEVRR